VGLQAEEDEDDTGRLSELIALAEAGLQAEEDEDAFFLRPQMKQRPLTIGDRQVKAMQMSLATCTRRRRMCSCLRPQMKQRPLTTCDRQLWAMQVSLAIATRLW
jgi:hypothetical protein